MEDKKPGLNNTNEKPTTGKAILELKKLKDVTKHAIFNTTLEIKQNTNIIEVQKLNAHFGTFSLKNINLEIKKNRSLGIIGPNGAGKTSLIKCIMNLHQVANGGIAYGFNKKDIYNEIGIQLQASVYEPNLRFHELVYLCHNSKCSPQKWVDDLIDMCNARPLLKKKLKSCSGGELQKINFIISVINKPKILILDEITTFLDPISRANVIRLIDKLKKTEKIAIIIVSHYLNELERLCDDFVFIKDGEVIEIETGEVLRQKYKINRVHNFLEPIFEKLYTTKNSFIID